MGLFSDGFKELKKASEPLYKSPKSIQETIEIMAVAEKGIFEVAKNRYSNGNGFVFGVPGSGKSFFCKFRN